MNICPSPSCFTTSINQSKVGWSICPFIKEPLIPMMMSIEDRTMVSQSLLSLPTHEFELLRQKPGFWAMQMLLPLVKTRFLAQRSIKYTLGSLPLLVPMVVKRIDLASQ